MLGSSRTLRTALASVASNWWVYTLYVIVVMTLAATSMTLFELPELGTQILVKGSIFFLAGLAVIIPPLLSTPRKLNYILSAGLISCLLTIRHFPWSNRQIDSLNISLTAMLILFFIFLIDKLKLFRRSISKKILFAYFSMLIIFITSFGMTGYYKANIRTLTHAVSNKTAKQYIAALNKNTASDLEYTDSFNEVITWVKANTPINGSFLCINDGYAQQFKLASRRPTIGSVNEVVCIASNSFKNKFFQDFIKLDKHLYISEVSYFSLLPGLMKKYRLNYVLLSKWKNLLQESEWFIHLFENKHFILFKLSQKGYTAGEYLPVHTMERQFEGPIHIDSKQGKPSRISYQDIFISQKMKYPKGKYSINVTASGKPDLPTQMRGVLTISVVKPEEQDLVIGKFELDASPKTFTTKEFALDSEEMFQLSFKKETQLIQTQVLQFDGIDDYVNIQFKTPLDLPEGTLTFWAAPAFSSSEQSSSVSLINFYTINGYKFEFADGLLGTPPERWPYFWFVWRRPDQYTTHINLYNPTFKTGEWIHWAGAWKISQNGNLHMEFYINGELVGQNTVLRNSISSGSLYNIFFDRLEVGLMGKDWHFMGSIADIRLFNKALQPVQFMQNPLKENRPFLVGYWKLLGFCNQTIPDHTKNHNDGTLGHDSSGGSDDPQCVEMQVPFAGDITINWLKDVMIKKLE